MTNPTDPLPDLSVTYRALLKAVQDHVDAAQRLALARRSPVTRAETATLAQRMLDLLADGETHSLSDLADVLGVQRSIAMRAAKRVVRLGDAAFTERRTALRLRKRRAGTIAPPKTRDPRARFPMSMRPPPPPKPASMSQDEWDWMYTWTGRNVDDFRELIMRSHECGTDSCEADDHPERFADEHPVFEIAMRELLDEGAIEVYTDEDGVERFRVLKEVPR